MIYCSKSCAECLEEILGENMKIKGKVWRAILCSTIKNVFDQRWDKHCITKEVLVVPVGEHLISAENVWNRKTKFPQIVLSIEDKKKYELDDGILFDVLNRACISLMRQGYEVLNDVGVFQNEKVM